MKAGASCLVYCRDAMSTWPVTEMAEVAMSSPTSSAPASPMNSRAGCQLSGRKPTQAPTSTAVSRDARLKYSACAIEVARIQL